MSARARMESAVRAAIAACDPGARVRAAVAELPAALGATLGLAIGKAALAMARGAGPVARGLAIAPIDDGGALPPGWTRALGDHPVPSERSLAAGAAAVALVASARPGDRVLALISGGASALCEQPRGALADLRARVGALVAAGAPIAEVNAARTALSTIKGGQLAVRCAGTLVTLVASDVIGDDPRVIGSGPTVGRAGDLTRVIAPMRGFADAVGAALGLPVVDPPIADDVAAVAAALAARSGGGVAWGEPTVALPPHPGRGGRAQQLALHLARHLRGTARAALVAASDGVDGPPPTASGAYVDGATWDAVRDPAGALARCDAGGALGDHLLHLGPTGINHGDVVVML